MKFPTNVSESVYCCAEMQKADQCETFTLITREGDACLFMIDDNGNGWDVSYCPFCGEKIEVVNE